jgi:hypothetical protein
VTSRDYHGIYGGPDGYVVGGGFWGGSKDLIQEKSEEGYAMIEVCLKGYIEGAGSDTTLNRQDNQSKFEHATLDEIVS